MISLQHCMSLKSNNSVVTVWHIFEKKKTFSLMDDMSLFHFCPNFIF